MSNALTIDGLQRLLPALRENLAEIAKLQTLMQKDLTRTAFNSLKLGSEFEAMYHLHREELKRLPKAERIPWKEVCRTFDYSDEQVRKLRIAHWALGHLTSDDLKTFIHLGGFLNSEEVLTWAAKAKQVGMESAFMACSKQPTNWPKVAAFFEKFKALEFKAAGSAQSAPVNVRSRDPFLLIRGMLEEVNTPGCTTEVEKTRFLRDLAAMERFIKRCTAEA